MRWEGGTSPLKERCCLNLGGAPCPQKGDFCLSLEWDEFSLGTGRTPAVGTWDCPEGRKIIQMEHFPENTLKSSTLKALLDTRDARHTLKGFKDSDYQL
jgi:hypothetical protein